MLDVITLEKNTPIKDFMPLPRMVAALPISSTAKLLYAVLLDRATLSQKNGYINKQGCVYVIYPVRELGKALGRKEETIRRCLNELELEGLVDRLRGHLGYNQLYVKLPDRASEWNRGPHGGEPTIPRGASPASVGAFPQF